MHPKGQTPLGCIFFAALFSFGFLGDKKPCIKRHRVYGFCYKAYLIYKLKLLSGNGDREVFLACIGISVNNCYNA